jgi:GTP-binding protein
MLDFLAEVEVPTIVALTKTDKLSKAVARDRAGEIARELAIETEQIIPFSAQTGEGRVDLLEAITTLVGVAP